MRTVRLLSIGNPRRFLRQSPADDGVFGTTQFVFDDAPADWVVVLNDFSQTPEFSHPKARSVFFATEPPSIQPPVPEYLSQFGTIVTVDPSVTVPGSMFGPPGLPWHVGVDTANPKGMDEALTFSQLVAAPRKTRLCSCITSSAHFTDGHNLRFSFLKLLRKELGDRVDFFGRGINAISDKDTGLAHYRYHIALENCSIPHYWTEKLADPFLRDCHPIYYGAPNIYDDFDRSALSTIDISEPRRAIEAIARILDSELYTKSSEAVAAAKRKVMWEHNLLARIDRMTTAIEMRSQVTGSPDRFRQRGTFLPPAKPKGRLLRLHEKLVGALREKRSRGRHGV